MDKAQFIDFFKLIPVYLLFIATFGQAGLEKVFSRGVPDWFLKQFSPTILNLFPGSLKIQYYLLAAMELTVVALFVISGFRMEFLGGEPREFLKLALLMALFTFFALGFGLRMSGDFQGAANLFLYFGVTFLIFAYVDALAK
jgi:hypothetical protein